MERYHRRSIRLKRYDYSRSGTYFITMCTHNRRYLFGNIVNGEMRLNKYGRVVKIGWLHTLNVRNNVELDAFVVMPNHIHGILLIRKNGRGVLQYAPTTNVFRSPSQTVGAIVRGFKSTVTKRINGLRGTTGMPVWQRNYYEHIIRDENELNRIREYIANNSLQWQFDRENPRHTKDNVYDVLWGPIEEAIYGR